MNETNSTTNAEGVPELKPCPFCGSSEITDNPTADFVILTHNETCWFWAMASLKQIIYRSFLGRWNTRSVPVEGEASERDIKQFEIIGRPLAEEQAAQWYGDGRATPERNQASYRAELVDRLTVMYVRGRLATIPTDKLEGEEKHSVNEDKKDC